MERIGAAFLITILLLSSAPLLFNSAPISSSTDIQPVAGGAQISISGSPSSISWHWDNPEDDHVEAVSISADGSYAVARTYRYKIHLFNKSSSTPVWSFKGDFVTSVEISADGNYIAAAGGSVWLFDRNENTPIWENDTGNFYSVAISQDGSYIAAANYHVDKVFLFSKDNSIPIRTYDMDSPMRVSISADGQYIAVGTTSADDSVYVLDKDYPEPIWRYKTGRDISQVAISADGSHLIAVGEYENLYLFRREDNSPLWSKGGVYAAAISSDGSHIAAGSYHYPEGLRYYSKESSTPLWEYSTWYGVSQAAISADGQYVAAINAEYVYLFDKDTGEAPFKQYTPVHYTDYVSVSAGADYIVWRDGDGVSFREVEIPGKTYTGLTVTPATFTLGSENSTTLTACLTASGLPLAGKTIAWTKTAGSLSSTSGITDNTGKVSIIYTAPSVTTYASVTVTASFAGDASYQSSSASSSGTINPAGPISTLIESEYNGFFLHNVNAITNTYRVALSHAENINGVVFQMGGSTQTDNTSPYEASFNMGNVGLNPTLNVTVYLTDGTTLSDNLSPTILETPAMLSQVINFFDDLGQVTVSKKTNGCWGMSVLGAVSVVKAAMSVASSVVPFNVGLGNYELPISDWKLGFTMGGDDYNERINFGSVGLSLDDAEFMGFAGLSFSAELSGGFTVRPDGRDEITAPTIKISVSGNASWSYEFGLMLGPIPITVTVSPHFGAGLGIDFGADNPIAVNDVSGYITGGVEVSAGVGIPGLSAGAYFDGTVTLELTAVPSFKFKRVIVTASVGVYLEALFWRKEWQLWSGSWSSNPGTKSSSQSETEWKLNERRYLGLGYSTFAWAAGNREGALVENVYSNPQPSLAVAENGSIVAAWTYDNPEKNLLQALEIAYSIYNPEQRTWSAPATITSDNFFDSNPKLTYMENGRVLAVWQRVPHQLENTVSPFAFVENIELAYSVFDLNTGRWSAPQLITSNSTYEALSALASCGGKTCLVYLRDSDNDIFTLDNQTLVATEWTGGSWGAEETIASGITVTGSPRLCLAGANDGILTFVRDMDDNVFSSTDRETFYLQYDGNWGTPTRLTTNNIEERSPSAGWANNRWYLSWIEMEPTENARGYTTSVRFGELATGQLAGSSSLLENQGVTDQSLLGEIQDKLYLLYQVGARGTPRLIRYDGSAWENVENFQWSPEVENARTSQLSVSVGGNYLGAIGATDVQAGEGQTFTSLHASIFSLSPLETPPVEIAATPWALIGGIIAVAAIGIIVVVIFFRRKRMISANK